MKKVRKYITSLFCAVVMILISITAIGNEAGDIEFPREEGPYTVWISGNWMGNIAPSVVFSVIDGYYRFGPISIIEYPYGHFGTLYHNSEDSGPGFFIVDGERQSLVEETRIDMKGFKGYYPGVIHYVFKLFYFGRVRMFGIVEEIDITPLT